MSSSKPFLPFCVVILALTSAPARAAEDRAQDKAAEAVSEQAAKAPPAGEIAEWIRQLDSDAFSEREAASEKLSAAGKAAAAALAEAAASDSLEVSTRAMKILRKLFDSPQPETKAAAKEALEKVAKSDHGSASRRAREAIEPKVEAPAFQPGAITAIATAINVMNHNGVKTIDVSTNGRKIKIHDDPKQGIKVEVTETKGGKQVTKIVEAKNADELKKKDPQAHEIYKQYSQGKAAGGMIQFQIQAQGIQGGGIQILPQIPPAIPLPFQPVPAFQGTDPVKRIDAATKQLQRLGKQLEGLAKDAKKPDEIQKALEQFQEELQRRLADVEKQLEEMEQKPKE